MGWKRRTRNQWQRLVEEWERSGLTQAAYCRKRLDKYVLPLARALADDECYLDCQGVSPWAGSAVLGTSGNGW
ncbi:IS66 family insertion sequence element accessory protein TnpA, partial [Wenzhouxiangella limi]|uniref:IS66 family insertion sequence element accessory protein TnpA n=1 Tax=Wenzhouxiangella limi TaxID=2707351 RepID=UPI003B82D80E